MELSPAKKALLEKWLKGKQAGSEQTRIPKRPQDSSPIISFPQQRHLFLELLDRGTAVNNLSVLLELSGELHTEALTASAKRILARHEALRTCFSLGMGMPAPHLMEDASIDIPVIPIEATDNAVPEAEVRRLAEREILQAFDLSLAPLIRLRLYRLTPTKHQLLVVIHHAVADGWSLGVFLGELMQFYQAELSESTPQVSDLPIQYSDYAHWQTSTQQLDQQEASLNYWKKQLSGELPVLEVPTDEQRTSRQSFTGGTYRFVISKQQIAGLEALSREEDGTLFMTLLSAYFILLQRYSGQDDILVGSPIANRHIPELQGLIGIFINTISLRANLSDTNTFRELLRQVRQTALDAYAHQDYPFEKLVEALKPKRDLNRPPLFQTVFNLQNAPMPELDIPGLQTSFKELDRGVAQFDLTLMLSKRAEGYEALVEYNAELFHQPSIARMFQSFQNILAFALKQADAPLSTLQLLSPEEWQQMVVELNQTAFDFPRSKCIHQLIEDQVASTPDAIAIVHEGVPISYQELDLRASSLAGRLQALGVQPEVRVGILIHKSVEMYVALLAVLKAGGAYVPIHLASPPQRILYILQDASAKVLLTNIDTTHLEAFEGEIINLHEKEGTLSDYSAFSPPAITPETLAYTIYTSGSTGQPKGVMIEHIQLVNFLWSMRESPGMNAETVTLALATPSFDPSTLELFLPLMVGGRVVIPSEQTNTNPLLLAEIIEQEKVNFLQATPATWQLLLDTEWPGRKEITAFCGGDMLSLQMAEQLLERVGELWNVYGPTEATVWASTARIDKEHVITIGRPIGNTQIYVLDSKLQPVPVGVIGEIHIAGAGLARCYLNNPQLTAEKFIPNPFSDEPESRMYKTGDLARFLPDYTLEILGRADHQVKVSGNRIEPGEVTAAFVQHPAVQDGIVVSKKDQQGEKRLVAYYVANKDMKPDAAALREFLSQSLPSYMIPSFFVGLESMPLNPNGKIDRKALPAPEDTRILSGYVAPRNEEEELLAEIWQNVLEVEQVGIHDNFFDLGGASIQSIQVVAKANMYGYPLSVEHIFEFQTIAELIEHLSGKSEVESGKSEV